jgi:hypothetical protein
LGSSSLWDISVAHARKGISDDWINYYDGSPGVTSQSDDNMVTGTGKTCQLCHELASGGGSWNGYGWELRTLINGGMTNEQAFAAAEAENSDGDPDQPPILPNGWSNLQEITYDAQPGWTSGSKNYIYDSGGLADSVTAPSVTPLDPELTVPVQPTTWGSIKRLYNQ